MVQELIGKYIWLIQTLSGAGDSGLSFCDIQDRWYDRYECEYARRSFNNHRIAIFDIFGIDIACDRRTNRYYIADMGSLNDSKDMTHWLIDSFTVSNLVQEGKRKLAGRISIENLPSGNSMLAPIMEAMLTENAVHISYLKYGSNQSEDLDVDPYAIKEFARRWYLIGFCRQRNALRVYGTDRIQSVEITEMDFDLPRNFDVERLFEGSFGIYIPDGHPEEIVFRTDIKQSGYLRDLPLHRSQRQFSSKEVEALGLDPYDNAVFSIRVCPGKDLLMELCRFGSNLEVLSPAPLRERMKNLLSDAAKMYSNE